MGNDIFIITKLKDDFSIILVMRDDHITFYLWVNKCFYFCRDSCIIIHNLSNLFSKNEIVI